jgi:putative transposase
MDDADDFTPPTQEEVRTDLQSLFRGAIRLVLESVLEQEVREMIGARRYERMGTRKDHRNGTYLRRLLTSMGLVEVAVPRTRHSGAAVEAIGRYKRRAPELDDAITTAYVEGVSTRDMSRVTEALMGEGVSRSTVSRVTKRLEDGVEALRKAPIVGPIPYLFLDATFLDARWARKVENVSALVAYGVGEDGHRQLLAVTIGAEESEASWGELLTQLNERGLNGVRLVIADDHRGLTNAVRGHLSEARLQRCTVHLERNVLTKAPQRLRGRLARAVSSVFDAPSLAEAKKRLAAFKGGLGSQVPEALACLENGFAAATQFFAFPKEHWRRIRSTNGLERLHGEVKRRTRAVGAFPDRASALRLVTAVAAQVTRIWADRRYLDMDLLKPPPRESNKEVMPKAA